MGSSASENLTKEEGMIFKGAPEAAETAMEAVEKVSEAREGPQK